MARIDASFATAAFDFRDAAIVDFQELLGTPSDRIYDWRSPLGVVRTDGVGYEYSGPDSIPSAGTTTQVYFDVGGNGTDILVSGLSASFPDLVNPNLPAEFFADLFWRELLEGADQVIGVNNLSFVFAGDARGVGPGITLFGANDRITGGTGGNIDLLQWLMGDFHINRGLVVGGNDTIIGRGDFFIKLAGDGLENFGTVIGGDDILTIDGRDSGQIFGDVETSEGAVFGGNDRITGSQGADSLLVGDVGFARNAAGVIGGDDVIFGRGGDDLLYGDNLEGVVMRGGNDRLDGGADDDELFGNYGSDIIEGGSGLDKAWFEDIVMTGARYTRVGDTTYVSQIATPQFDVDTLTGIETIVTFVDIFPVTDIVQFDGLAYVATYRDLALGLAGQSAAAINAAGARHFAFEGYFEGRLTEGHIPFDAAQYRANYSDLAGLNTQQATLHYINSGLGAGRLGFDAMVYIASYADLRTAFGTNEAAALSHWHNTGRAAGRTVTFDAAQYIENYSDLQSAFGTNLAGATRHFVTNGARNNRTDLDPLDYVASYSDLIEAFGDYGNAPLATIMARGLTHYANTGRAQGRDASFDAWQYLENYQDLREAFGTDVDAAALHFISHGYYEGRTDDNLLG